MAYSVLSKYVFVVVYFLLAITVAGALAAHDVSTQRSSLFIVPRLDGTVSAFDAFTGKPLWNFSTGGHLLQSSEPSVSAAEVSIFNAIQREGLQDVTEKSSILGATPFMSPDGTIFLTHKSSKLFALDPSTGDVISSNVMDTASGENLTPLFTEGPVCKTSLHIVRTEHTLETHNDTAMRYLTVSNVRAFLRDCSNGEVTSGNAGANKLPQLTTTPMGDLQAYDSDGNLLWFSSLPSSPSSLVYALTGNSIQPIRPNLPPRLPSQYVPLSLSNYKGTPFELGMPEVTKTLALPAPADSHHRDPARKSIWYWIATICVCATAAIWGLIILKYQNWRLSASHPTPSTPPPTSSSSMPRSASTQKLQAEHEQLQKQFRELQEQQQILQQQERQRSQSWAQLPLPPPLPPPPASAEPSNALSRYRTDFEEKERLGEGGFGTVFRAVNKLDGVEYAVKKVCLSTSSSKENERVLREVRHLAVLDHPNIIRYYQSWIEEDEWNGSRNGSFAGDGEEDEESSHYDEDDVESEGDADSAGSEDEGVDSEGDYEGDESKAGSTTSQGDDESNTSRDSESFGIKLAHKQLDFSKSGLSVYDSDSSLDASRTLSISEEIRSARRKRGKREKREKRGDVGLDITFERTYGSTSTSMSAVTATGSGPSTPCRRTILYIQMQYCHQGTLQHWLNRTDRVICPQEAIAIFRQAVRGVAHIHANFVIHRDLKPPNILISADGSVKIGDFGLATGAIDGGPLSPMRILTRSHTTGVGSPLYCSPEQLKGDRYDSKVDIFSLGIILYEMFHIFSTQMERVSHITQLREGRINSETQELYPKLAELALSLVQANPDLRPPASEILTHPFLSTSP